MEISENERLILIKKKEEIAELTSEILNIYRKPEHADEVKAKISKILSNISTISWYSSSKNGGIDTLVMRACQINDVMEKEGWSWDFVIKDVDEFCVLANAIQIEFTNSGLNIHIPKVEIPVFQVKL